ncbi:chlorohydrolase [Streptococcus pneumoniae]|uniref:hypothetical protein n=1 Tax=Streptococcus pneumoniae TaxID=1313 RepID=UPI0005E3F62C|nr:hypothetical protein [Streptococcus pneumoniae]CMX37097.1 chlorohydrolase [Streptococcus pneumoniae]
MELTKSAQNTVLRLQIKTDEVISKYCFKVVDGTDEVSSKHCFEVADKKLTWFEEIFEEY